MLWLLDAALQYQPFMFSRAFATQVLAPTAEGNPAPVAASVRWAAEMIAAHGIAANAVFATVQLALAVGLLWRRTVRLALAASIVWSVGVWWFGEGLGGVLTGQADPATGAPGAVILYAFAAVLLWPPSGRGGRPASGRPVTTSVAAASPLGGTVSRLLWLVLWGSLAYFALLPVNRVADGPRDVIAAQASGEPGWLAGLDHAAARAVAGAGMWVAVVSAVVLVAVGVGVFARPPVARAALVGAVLVGVVYWVIGENFGVILTGQATDPNSGPLLVLLALTYWPTRTHDEDYPRGRAPRRQEDM